MKRVLFSAALFFISVLAGKAQTGKVADNVTVNIKLYPIHTLVLNPASEHKVVDLEYKTENDYLNGVSAVRENHLSIFSTGGYAVTVKSTNAELTSQINSPNGNINANTINITASNGTNSNNEAAYFSQALSTMGGTILTATNGGIENTYNIIYNGKNGNAYLNYYVAGQNPTVYTTTVTYTIVAK